MRGKCDSDEPTHRMSDQVERIGIVEVGDLQQIADMAVPTVCAAGSYLASATASQVHGHNVVTGGGERGHQAVE